MASEASHSSGTSSCSDEEDSFETKDEAFPICPRIFMVFFHAVFFQRHNKSFLISFAST